MYCMNIPNYNDIMLPMLQYLSDEKIHSFKKINEHLIIHLKLTDEERDQLTPKGNKKVFDSRCEWSRFYLKKAGLMENPKSGWCKISKEGVLFLKSHSKSITRNTLLVIPAFSKFMKETYEKSYSKNK